MRTFGMEVECIHDSPRTVVDAINAAIAAARQREELVTARPFAAKYTRRFEPNGIAVDEEECGIECRLPPLTLEEWPLVPIVLRTLRECGATVRRSNGGHMHLGWQDVPEAVRSRYAATWVGTWNVFDTVLRRLVARSRRNNPNCTSGDLNDWAHMEQTLFARTTEQLQQAMSSSGYYFGREWVGNAMVAYKNDFQTTEVRLHHATLNPRRWKYWAVLMNGLMDFSAAMSRENTVNPLRRARTTLQAFASEDWAGKAAFMLSLVRPHVSLRRYNGLLRQTNERLTTYN